MGRDVGWRCEVMAMDDGDDNWWLKILAMAERESLDLRFGCMGVSVCVCGRRYMVEGGTAGVKRTKVGHHLYSHSMVAGGLDEIS